MAFTSGFFNSVNHDRKYDAVQMGQIFDGIIKDGIYATYLSAMVVKESANASEVIVQPGRAWFNHVWAYNDADYPMAAPDPEVVLDRIDTLVLDVNSEDAVREAKYMWVQGTPTSQIPEPPELIHTVTHNQYPLADVKRQAGTTQIYADDITNRVGTSDCPFVTGIIDTINIDSLLRQWDAEFHTWENATKASFEGWMVNQESVYTLWWNSMKAQMEGDVADLEAWIETIHDILDEEVATRLQAEIDEIKTQLPSGSHITVTTLNSELFNRTVTITDEDNNVVTSEFNASGVAVFKTVPYVGNLTIESTDGIRTATNTVNTPYFARYSFALAFWSATVNIDGDTELGGSTCVVTDSNDIVVTSIVLNASGDGVFNATYPDTYKFSVTYGGQTMEVSLAVTQETTYTVSISAGFNWRSWVTASGLDPTDYTDLDELLSNSLAVRRLFTKHASVDYLCSQSRVNDDLSTIINNDICAKWINLRDYALDNMYANAAIKTAMDTADKYGYGEWVIVDDTTTPPTWGPKGAVPKMTSNTAPYGEVIGSSNTSGIEKYLAFDKSNNTHWSAANGTYSGAYIGYKSTNPIKVKKVSFTKRQLTGYNGNCTAKIQASNDGTTWVDLTDILSFCQISANAGDTIEWDVTQNEGYYLQHRLYYLSQAVSESLYPCCCELQFYGRSLDVSVPVMTANTTPYGEVFFEHDAIASDEAPLWKAFDGNDSTPGVLPLNTYTSDNIGYKFSSKVRLKKVQLLLSNSTYSRLSTVQIKYSNDGTTFYNATEAISVTSYRMTIPIEMDASAQYWEMDFVRNEANKVGVYGLQFYGVDYSEKEFETGATRKWLYDHGVELETLTETKLGSGIVNKNSDDLHLEIPASSQQLAGITASVDLTNYNYLRAKCSNEVDVSTKSSSDECCSLSAWTQTPNTSATGRTAVSYVFPYASNNNLPNNLSLNVSSINQTVSVGIVESNASTSVKRLFNLAELWLE